MKPYFLSLIRIASMLKVVCLIFVFLGGFLAFLGLAQQNTAAGSQPDPCHQLLIVVGSALVGFAASAFFSRQDRIMLRGVKDAVYLLENHLCIPNLYVLTDFTVCAIGERWQDIHHITENLMTQLHHCPFIGKGQLDIAKANLYKLAEPQKSVYAVLQGTRYGVPDDETRDKIWGPKSKERVIQLPDTASLDKYLPGFDLTSVQYWPARFRQTPSPKR